MKKCKMPIGWASTTIVDVVAYDGVFTDGDWVESKDQDPNGDIRLIQLADVGDGYFVDKSSRFLTREKSQDLKCTFLQRDDLLVARMPAPLGRCCIFPLDGIDKFVTVVDVCAIRPGSSPVVQKYLMYVINSPCTRTAIESLQSGSTRKRISRKNLATVNLPLAPLNEQRRIVARIEELFSELDKGVESLRKARIRLGVYRKALLKKAFEGKLTASWRAEHADGLESADALLARIRQERRQFGKRKTAVVIGEQNLTLIPDSWCFTSIDELTLEGLVGLVKSSREQNNEKNGCRYIKMDRIDVDGNLKLETDVYVFCRDDEIKKFHLKKGDILFNTRNSIELVGKTGIVSVKPLSVTVYNNNLMRLRFVPSVLPEFICAQMCSQDFRKILNQVKKSTTSVAAIYGKDLWPLPVRVCSYAEQKEIVRILEEQFSIIKRSEREIDAALSRARTLRQSILKKAFSGYLVSQNPNDEPASVLLERIRTEKVAYARTTTTTGQRRCSKAIT